MTFRTERKREISKRAASAWTDRRPKNSACNVFTRTNTAFVNVRHTNVTNGTNETNGTTQSHMTLSEESRGGRSERARVYFLNVVAYLTLLPISLFLWTSILVAWHALVHGVDVSLITIDWRKMAVIVNSSV